MKYDVLHRFRELLEQEPLSENTRKQYYNFTKKILINLEWSTAAEIDPAAVADALAGLKTANDVSAARNGLHLFCRYFSDCPVRELPTARELHKRNHAKRKWEPLALGTVKRKINSLPDEDERLAYRAMLSSGMRVSEVTGLYPEDVTIAEDGRLCFALRHTKKGCADLAYSDDPYLLEHLPEFMRASPPGQPIFKACQTLKNKAGDLDFECHDLRRAFALGEYDKAKRELSRDDALDRVREELRHESERTTKRYLRRAVVK